VAFSSYLVATQDEAMTDHPTCSLCGCSDEHVKQTITKSIRCINALIAKVKKLEAFVAAYDNWCQRGILVFRDPDCGLTLLRHARKELDK